MEWLAVSIGLGLLVSLLFTELFGLSVGGMIVPGYLAMSLDQPLTVVLTLVAAIATWGVVHFIDRWAILFGRRRVVLTIVIGFAIGSLLRVGLTMVAPPAVSPDQETVWNTITVIGFVIPGLIAIWIQRTGPLQTLSPLIVATCLVRLVLVAVGMETPG